MDDVHYYPFGHRTGIQTKNGADLNDYRDMGSAKKWPEAKKIIDGLEKTVDFFHAIRYDTPGIRAGRDPNKKRVTRTEFQIMKEKR